MDIFLIIRAIVLSKMFYGQFLITFVNNKLSKVIFVMFLLTLVIENCNGVEANENYSSFSTMNTTCDHDSIKDFPKDIFTDQQRKHGAIVIHIFATIYFFTVLAVVCEYYFLPAVECICHDLNLSKDVAAATFMASATTMPEFFTNTISTLITQSDMGLGTIIGSLMFNTLGVAALSSVAINKSVQLDWWPVSRDCIFYAFNTILLIIIAWDGIITFIETLIMVIMCVLYFTVMFLNTKIMKGTRVLVEDTLNCCLSQRYDLTLPPERSAKAKLPIEKLEKVYNEGIFIICPSELSSTTSLTSKENSFIKEEKLSFKENYNLFQIPNNGYLNQFWWIYTWPINAFLACLCPNPKTHRKLYPLTFALCIILIGSNSYMIVWMLTVFGSTFEIPETLMGLTFLAAGATMPEALSSLMMMRKGEGGIGVSNALGANSLAILFSLGVPWFIKNSINYHKIGNNIIVINSRGIEYTIGILLLSNLSLFIILSVADFRLRRRVGIALFAVYIAYITLQILIETNTFF